mmetsp:Transcript_16247/g.39644  ORF Transcript_16247/g.39644 Transcript_16247/m.39644 type:complete len:1822 (+) Transcript_16247:769-6234(+)
MIEVCHSDPADNTVRVIELLQSHDKIPDSAAEFVKLVEMMWQRNNKTTMTAIRRALFLAFPNDQRLHPNNEATDATRDEIITAMLTHMKPTQVARQLQRVYRDPQPQGGQVPSKEDITFPFLEATSESYQARFNQEEQQKATVQRHAAENDKRIAAKDRYNATRRPPPPQPRVAVNLASTGEEQHTALVVHRNAAEPSITDAGNILHNIPGECPGCLKLNATHSFPATCPVGGWYKGFLPRPLAPLDDLKKHNEYGKSLSPPRPPKTVDEFNDYLSNMPSNASYQDKLGRTHTIYPINRAQVREAYARQSIQVAEFDPLVHKVAMVTAGGITSDDGEAGLSKALGNMSVNNAAAHYDSPDSYTDEDDDQEFDGFNGFVVDYVYPPSFSAKAEETPLTGDPQMLVAGDNISTANVMANGRTLPPSFAIKSAGETVTMVKGAVGGHKDNLQVIQALLSELGESHSDNYVGEFPAAIADALSRCNIKVPISTILGGAQVKRFLATAFMDLLQLHLEELVSQPPTSVEAAEGTSYGQKLASVGAMEDSKNIETQSQPVQHIANNVYRPSETTKRALNPHIQAMAIKSQQAAITMVVPRSIQGSLAFLEGVPIVFIFKDRRGDWTSQASDKCLIDTGCNTATLSPSTADGMLHLMDKSIEDVHIQGAGGATKMRGMIPKGKVTIMFNPKNPDQACYSSPPFLLAPRQDGTDANNFAYDALIPVQMLIEMGARIDYSVKPPTFSYRNVSGTMTTLPLKNGVWKANKEEATDGLDSIQAACVSQLTAVTIACPVIDFSQPESPPYMVNKHSWYDCWMMVTLSANLGKRGDMNSFDAMTPLALDGVIEIIVFGSVCSRWPTLGDVSGQGARKERIHQIAVALQTKMNHDLHNSHRIKVRVTHGGSKWAVDTNAKPQYRMVFIVPQNSTDIPDFEEQFNTLQRHTDPETHWFDGETTKAVMDSLLMDEWVEEEGSEIDPIEECTVIHIDVENNGEASCACTSTCTCATRPKSNQDADATPPKDNGGAKCACTSACTCFQQPALIIQLSGASGSNIGKRKKGSDDDKPAKKCAVIMQGHPLDINKRGNVHNYHIGAHPTKEAIEYFSRYSEPRTAVIVTAPVLPVKFRNGPNTADAVIAPDTFKTRGRAGFDGSNIVLVESTSISEAQKESLTYQMEVDMDMKNPVIRPDGSVRISDQTWDDTNNEISYAEDGGTTAKLPYYVALEIKIKGKIAEIRLLNIDPGNTGNPNVKKENALNMLFGDTSADKLPLELIPAYELSFNPLGCLGTSDIARSMVYPPEGVKVLMLPSISGMKPCYTTFPTLCDRFRQLLGNLALKGPTTQYTPTSAEDTPLRVEIEFRDDGNVITQLGGEAHRFQNALENTAQFRIGHLEDTRHHVAQPLPVPPSYPVNSPDSIQHNLSTIIEFIRTGKKQPVELQIFDQEEGVPSVNVMQANYYYQELSDFRTTNGADLFGLNQNGARKTWASEMHRRLKDITTTSLVKPFQPRKQPKRQKFAGLGYGAAKQQSNLKPNNASRSAPKEQQDSVPAVAKRTLLDYFTPQTATAQGENTNPNTKGQEHKKSYEGQSVATILNADLQPFSFADKQKTPGNSKHEQRWDPWEQDGKWVKALADPMGPLAEAMQKQNKGKWLQMRTSFTVETNANEVEKHRLWKIEGTHRRMVPKPQERVKLLTDTHTAHGHWGVNRTLVLAAKNYWMPRMKDIVTNIVSTCTACQKVRVSFDGYQPTMQPLPIKGLYYRWSLDLATMPYDSNRGNKYIIVMIEHYSKYVELVAIPNKEAKYVAAAFRERVIARHGGCAEVLTDNVPVGNLL